MQHRVRRVVAAGWGRWLGMVGAAPVVLCIALGCSDDGQSASPQPSPHESPDTLHAAHGDAGSCAAIGASCAQADCCEGRCQASVCVAADAPVLCAAIGASCAHTDCCDGVCESSVCVREASCVPVGGDCSERDCCGGSCSGSICR